MQKLQTIKDIIDTHLMRIVNMGLNKLPVNVESLMVDPNQDKNDEWQSWLPVESTVVDEEVVEFEGRLGYKLPSAYVAFLKHKHFYELHISSASFCAHPSDSWRARLTEMVFDGYPREFLIDKGYIPFADWSDWGLLCFDANKHVLDFNYPIVLWDHERANEVEPHAQDFFDLIFALDKAEKEREVEDDES
ncbi:SMI1/KNR4 family protein [Paraflavitalea pollutisoli]|uniref:SMI1/KNR4 family protein n=1 Tax=Paraflavitalea pollutisoli TaxID=3034143 RepID=UPI0023ED16E3|nr:SMI1/KNR4 family protein [Paraflavitalea sp. H1-2-19X]